MKGYYCFFTVFGWFHGTDITLSERTSTYDLQAGFIKGGAVQTFVTAQGLARFEIAVEERGAGKWSYQTRQLSERVIIPVLSVSHNNICLIQSHSPNCASFTQHLKGALTDLL